MRTSFSIAFTNEGQLRMRVAGKLTGHAAREGLELLQTAARWGGNDIMLDLRETTSLDSLGIRIFHWIRRQNGNLKVEVIPPMLGVSDEELAVIACAASPNSSGDRHHIAS
ncbi:MAG: hypothetical protein E3J72_22610 [Planctomycetota bacterium]|nr:MAG: hypothetical protein E3J72_22610 [Planctomycetota bacterium]